MMNVITTDKEIIIKKDRGFDKTSSFTWINFESYNRRIGKARIFRIGKSLRINSIIIFPEFERNGYAQSVISIFKEQYNVILADRARNTAKGFWKKMGFVADNSGNYIWRKGG